jgi:hypothetical protein
MDPINPQVSPVPPAVEAPSGETMDLTESFLKGGLDFQAQSSPASAGDSAQSPNVAVDDVEDTFEAQAAREGWNAAQPAAQPAQPAAATPTATQAQVSSGLYTANGQRNYSGLSPEEVLVFKEMGRASYEKLRPVYDQHRQWESSKAEREAKETERENLIKELKGQHFYDLEDSWQLDPEIKPLAAAQQSLAAEADFWQQQLASIDKQEKIRLLVAGPDGKPVLTAPMDPEPEHRALITRAMQDALGKHAQVSSQLTQNVQGFKARYQGWDSMISEQTNRVFGKLDKLIGKSRDEIMQQFPAALRHKPIYTYAANATAAIAMLLRDNETLKKRVAGQQLNQPAAASATPRAATTATGSPDHLNALERLAKLSGTGIKVPR